MTVVRRRHPERAEQAAIRQLLLHLGADVWTLGTTRRRGDYPGTMQTPGLPDLLAVLPRGLGVLFVEVKAPGGRLRDEQRRFRQACVSCELPYRVHHVVGGQDAVIAYLVSLGLVRVEQVPHYRVPRTGGS